MNWKIYPIALNIAVIITGLDVSMPKYPFIFPFQNRIKIINKYATRNLKKTNCNAGRNSKPHLMTTKLVPHINAADSDISLAVILFIKIP